MSEAENSRRSVVPDEWRGDNVRLVADVVTRDGMKLKYGFMGAHEDGPTGFAWDDGNRWHYTSAAPRKVGVDWMWEDGGNRITVRQPTAEELPRIRWEIDQ